MTWGEKQKKMMKLLKKDQTVAPDHGCEHPLYSWATPLKNEWDFLPKGRVKVAEGQGVICPFKLQINTKSNFTGVLKPSKRGRGGIRAVAGIARLSPETNFYSPISPMFYPAMALKIFR